VLNTIEQYWLIKLERKELTMNCPKCAFEYDAEQIKFCPECGAPRSVYCANCQKEHNHKFCPECGMPEPAYAKEEHAAPFTPQQQAPPQFQPPPQQPYPQYSPQYQQPYQPQAPMPNIVINNTSSNVNTNNNTNTNANVGSADSRQTPPPKSRILALILCVFLGGIGAHHFYTGKVGMGILYLFTAGLFGIGWVIDILRILLGTFRDKWGYQLA
jgi:hypothetical protein